MAAKRKQLTMTPLPKYLAKSNTPFGMCGESHLVRLARTGNNAPKSEPIMTMKTEAMRRPVEPVEPPPEPQLTSSSDIAVLIDAGRGLGYFFLVL